MEKMFRNDWDEDDEEEEEEEVRETMIGSPSSDGKMVIKLKIPKTLGSPAINGEKPSLKRVCLECKKEFSSGKALGGHMRIHAHNNNKNKNPNFLKQVSKATKFKKPDSNKPYYMNSVNEEGEPTCSQCGKTFPSMKSLFGHMRCHPERVWGGGGPPPNMPTPVPPRHLTPDHDDNDQVVDLTKFLRGWSVTDRRGRKTVKSVKPSEDDVVLLGAVEDLLSLANGGSVTNESDEKLLVDNKSKKIKRRKKMKLMMELDQVEHEQEQERNGDVFELQQDNKYKYKCTTCNKCFATHQALGGHRSSHYKSKLTSTDYDKIEIEDENVEKLGLLHLHQCKICDKVFATGQALGGHKRCHWTGSMEQEGEAPSSQITSTGEAASGSGRKVLEFDLNEVPPMMMEEDEYEYEYAYASSSYNSNMG